MTALVSKPKDPRYYIDQDRDRGEFSQSVWVGPAAERFGLTDFQPRHFLNLWDGREPHGGKPVAKNRNSPDRVRAYDMVVSFDGTMKLLDIGPDPHWRTNQQCKMAAYRKAAEVMQERCGWTRLGHGGAKKERADLFIALHPDLDSRWGGAPLGHCHITAMGVAVRKGGQAAAADGSRFYREQVVINAAAQLEYANEVTKRLGLRVVRKGDHAALPGRFDALVRDLSPASETIKREMKANGFHSPKAKTILAQRLKPAKVRRSVDKLRALWQKVADRHDFTWQRLERRRRLSEFKNSIASAEFRAVKHAEKVLASLTRANSQVTERELLKESLLSAIGKGLTVGQVLDGVQYLVRSRRVYSLGQQTGSPTFTTKEVWRSERRTLRHAEALAKKNRLSVVSGFVRAAKEHMVAGRRVVGVRPSGIEAVLTATDKGSRLNAHWQAFRAAGKSGFGFDIQARLKAAERAYREARKPVSRADRRTVYVVEDLHHIPTASLEKLLKHARSAGAKVVLCEPPHGATKAASGILPQLLDLNREVARQDAKVHRRGVDREMGFMH